MASGIEVDDMVKTYFENMKVVKKDDDENERVKVAILAIKEDEGKIVVDKEFKKKDLGDRCAFSIIKKEMTETPAFYALYDCHFQTTDNVENDNLIFLVWSNDEAPIKKKMLYSSSVDSLRKCFCGLKHEMQVNDLADWTMEEVAKKIQCFSTRKVAKIDNTDI